MPGWRPSPTNRCRLSRCRGMSLIPVMVSIAIFTAIALQYTIPQQQLQLRESNVKSAQITAAQILSATLDYRVDTGFWPASTDDLSDDYLPIINNNPWGNRWTFYQSVLSPQFDPDKGLILFTQAGDNQAAIALAARFGGIARVCFAGNNPCNNQDNNGTWVYIGIAKP